MQVHSSPSRLGYVVGVAEAVVDALLETVGLNGTVMVPSFNHGQADIYDPMTTPSVNGAVTEAFRNRPEAIRSVHPTHLCAAIGPLAEWLTMDHLSVETFSMASPLGKLASLDGLVLMLGVGMFANTSAHLGEAKARVHCIGFNQWPRRVRLEDGWIIPGWSVVWRNGPCRIEWDPLENRMRENGFITYGQIDEGETKLMRSMDAVNTAFNMANELCGDCPTQPDWNAYR